MKKRKQQTCKPGSVSLTGRDVCHLSKPDRHRQALAVYPPTWGEQPSLMPVYMTLQLLRCTAHISLCGWWALTPPSHPYSNGSGNFLLHYSTLADSFLLGSRMLCVARTFLLYKIPATDRSAAFLLQRYGNKLKKRQTCQKYFYFCVVSYL